MMGRIFDIAVIVVGGVIVADLVAKPTGTKNLINGIQGLWTTSVNGMLGKTS